MPEMIVAANTINADVLPNMNTADPMRSRSPM